MKKETSQSPYKVGDILEVSPYLTMLDDWIIGKVIKIFKNPFI